jgi:hypothetical protein
LKSESSINPQKQNDIPVFITTFTTDWFPEKKSISIKFSSGATFKKMFYSFDSSGSISLKALHGKINISLDFSFPGNKEINQNGTKINMNLSYEFIKAIQKKLSPGI